MATRKLEKEILCTLGPASRNERVISRLEDIGVSLFRINLSHTKVEDIDRVIEEIKAHTSVPICLDTEGAQVRTGDLAKGSVNVYENRTIKILNYPIAGGDKEFNLYPCNIVSELEAGDLISIDFNSVLVQVIERLDDGVMARVLTGGMLGQNKAVTVDRDLKMPPLTEKDQAILKIGMQKGITHVALSFANKGEDVDFIREIVGDETFLISKIESINGIQNIKSIAGRSNAILLDRGDLSREVPIEQIPRAQKEMIRRGKECGAKVYVATNLLESMITAANPTRAEVNDVFNTLIDGADGLVLAAETAIGSHPVQCAMMVSKIIQQFSEFDNGSKFSTKYLKQRNSMLLVEPHGGKLVNRIAQSPNWDDINTYKKVSVDVATIMNTEQIAIGTYSPLQGFMSKEELESVIKTYRLPNGLVWPLPITLQTNEIEADKLIVGEKVALCLEETGHIHATIEIEEIYQYDLDEISEQVFKTKDTQHPGVRLLKSQGSFFVAGKIELLKRLPSEDKHFEITPKQARKIFENKGWSRVVGFHTRNVAHRVHEYLQLQALEKYHCDGILIHPLIGPKKKGDYSAQIILKSYDLMIQKYYPEAKVLLGAFQNYPRYSGPREAVFTALCRKNFGCSHFIVGRDHSGVGQYYEPDAGHRLFDELGDIGIKPIYFNAVHYHKTLKEYVEETESEDDEFLKISGTQGREMLVQKKLPPDWFMREDISKLIIDEMNDGKEVFLK